MLISTMLWVFMSAIMTNIIGGRQVPFSTMHDEIISDEVSQNILLNESAYILNMNVLPWNKYKSNSRYKRFASVCSSRTWWNCLLQLPLGIEWRLRLDVLKFFDQFVTGRKTYLNDAAIAGKNALINREKIQLDNLREFRNASDKFRSADEYLAEAILNSWRHDLSEEDINWINSQMSMYNNNSWY